MSKRKKYIWMASMPEIFGYGLIVAEQTEELAMKALKKEYYAWRKARTHSDYPTFNRALEEWGGKPFKVELGKVYNDGFRN